MEDNTKYHCPDCGRGFYLEPQSKWHTGTPTEEGWYVGYTNDSWFVILRWNGKAFDVYSDYRGDIVAWQKITPYEGEVINEN